MSLFKIMPHAMIGTLYQGEYTKIVKLRLKHGKRLPKHQQEDYNVFIITTDGCLQADVNDDRHETLQVGDLFQMGGEHEFSLVGQAEENPFLYFIVPKTQDIDIAVSSAKVLGCCYSDDLIQFSRYQLSDQESDLVLNSLGNELIVLCYGGEAGIKIENPAKDHIYRFMRGDILHVDGGQTIKISKKDLGALIFVICLRLA